MSIYGFQQPIPQPQQRKNQSTLAALALLALRQQQSASSTVDASPNLLRYFVNNVLGNDAGPLAGTLDQPFKTIRACLTAIGTPTSMADFEKLIVINVEPGNYTAEGMLTLTSRQWCFLAPNVQLPPLQVNADNALRFGSIRGVVLTVVGQGGDLLYGFSGVPVMTPSGFATIGDGKTVVTLVRKSATSVPLILDLFNCHTIGQLGWRDDSGSGGFVTCHVQLQHCLVEPEVGGACIRAFGVSLPNNAILTLRECWLPSSTCVITVGALFECSDSTVDAQFTVSGVAGGPFVFGFKGTVVGANTTWAGPPGAMLLDGFSNYWLKTNGAAIIAPQKTIQEDVVP